MADLSQHAAYTGDFSGLLNNLWLTLAIGGVCLVGYEIEVRIPRRRGWDGTKRTVWVRIYWAARGGWKRIRTGGKDRRHHEEGLQRSREPTVVNEKDATDPERERLGDREAWEFG